MSDFNSAQVLAEAYTLYKKHHDGMGLDFKIAINQVREESEQRGAERAFDEAVEEIASMEGNRMILARYKHLNPYRADQMEGDDGT